MLFMLEKTMLQATVVLASLVPISAGMAVIIAGPQFVGASVFDRDLVSHAAYLSGLLLAIGIAFLVSVPRIEHHAQRFQLLGALVVTGGLARLFSGLTDGFGSLPHQAALVMELGVTPMIVAWQNRIAGYTK
jgi:hypothetical protein